MKDGKTYQQREQARIYSQYTVETGIPDWVQKGQDEIQEVMEAFRTIIDFGNNMSRRPQHTAEILADVLQVTHRTLQQVMMSTIINLILQYSEFRTDGRNEYTVQVCKEIRTLLEDKTFDGVFRAPFI